MRIPPAARIARFVLTVLCAALPATALLFFVYTLVGQGLFGYLAKTADLQRDDVIAILLSTGLIISATLGTLGLWRVAFQKEYVNRLNAALLVSGVLAMSPVILLAIDRGPMWFIPLPTDQESREALILQGPLYTAIAYLVAMARHRFRANRGPEQAGR